MPLPKGLPGTLAVLLAAAPLFAFTPAEERAIAFLQSEFPTDQAEQPPFSFEPSPCLHSPSAYDAAANAIETNARAELVWHGLVGPSPTGPLTPRGTFFAALEGGGDGFYLLSVSDTEATAILLPLPQGHRNRRRFKTEAKVWTLPVAEAEAFLQTFDALMRLHAPAKKEVRRHPFAFSRLSFSFTEANAPTPRFACRNSAYIPTPLDHPEVRIALSLGEKASRSTLLYRYIHRTLTPPKTVRPVPFQAFADAQLEQALARPGSVPDPLLALCAQRLIKQANARANARFAQLLEQRLGLPAPEALNLIAAPQPFRDAEQAECDRALAEGWVMTLADPTPEQWLALLRLGPSDSALIQEAAKFLAKTAPEQLESELLACFQRPGSDSNGLWEAMRWYAPRAAITLINHPFPPGADPVEWAQTYLEYFLKLGKPSGALAPHRLDALVALLHSALQRNAVPSHRIADLFTLLETLDRLPNEATRLHALDAMLAGDPAGGRDPVSGYDAACALANAMLQRGSRAGWEKVKPLASRGVLSYERHLKPLLAQVPEEEAREVCRTSCHHALTGDPVAVSMGEILVCIARYRLTDCLPLLRPYAATEGEPDLAAIAISFWPEQPLACPPSVIVRDFLQAFTDEAAFDAFLSSNTNPAWRERLNLHALYSWLQARKTAP